MTLEMTSGVGGAAGESFVPVKIKPIRPREFKRSDIIVLGAAGLAAYCITWILFDQLTLLSGQLGFVLFCVGFFLGLYWVVNRQLFTRQVAVDRFVAALMTLGALAMFIPLLLLVVFVVARGWNLLSAHVFVATQKGVSELSPVGKAGVAHAIVGTLEQVGLAALIGVPAAVLTAIFINEIGGRFTRTIRVVVTAMSGTPAIVAGIFIYAIWIATFHQGYSGFAGALALAVLLLPTVTRGTEEVLKVVHQDLREASIALAAPEWRTVWSVVLPTARSGLVTSVLLGVAVSIGETAPLLMTVFGNKLMNTNPFNGPQAALPLMAYQQIKLPLQADIDLGYTAALVLFLLVFTLFIVARLLAGGRRRTPGFAALRSRIVNSSLGATEIEQDGFADTPIASYPPSKSTDERDQR